jgi:two-component system sensor histidine kinase BarA
MTVVNGYISMLQREQLGSLNDQQQAVLEKMSSNTRSLINLVNDMLDLSKLEANKLEINLVDSPLDQLINESIDKINVLYGEKGVKLSYDGLKANIKTDPDKFERILLNLLSNAIKFTPAEGSVTVTSQLDPTTKLVTIAVIDTGIGIAPEALDGLFHKFSQVDNYLQRQTGGTGLGLAICKQMVEKLGGTIGVDSTSGKGSRFWFTMPGGEVDEVTVS